MDYDSIDYLKWDLSGEGKNIYKLFNKLERKIWKASLEYQDKRNDSGHAEVVTYFAFKLQNILNGERKVIIPAAINHDIGWSQLSKTELSLFAYENWKKYERILRERHQEEGVKLTEKILKEQKYFKKDISHILEIISQHDTREGVYSLEDSIVRDADKLWRFTYMEIETITKKRKSWNMSLMDIIKRAETWISSDKFFYSEVSRKIAEIELNNSVNFFRG